jgi:N-acetylglucosaminyldiphosphoundecaprenol N-acetyl-beta-D-mannosaminyltransferase
LRRTLLGCEVDFLKSEAILDALRVRHAEGRPTLIGYHNLHTLYMATQEARLAGFYQRADIIYADGMPLIMWARLLGLPVTRDHRMTLSSWAPEVLRSFQGNGWRLFYLGASAEACAKGVAAFRSLAPGLEIEARDGCGPTEGLAPNVKPVRTWPASCATRPAPAPPRNSSVSTAG